LGSGSGSKNFKEESKPNPTGLNLILIPISGKVVIQDFLNYERY